MTALSSDDQRERGENLGADRYLVKSQVGIEDVINVVHEVLGDKNADGTINTSVPQAQDTAVAASETPDMTMTVGNSFSPAVDMTLQVQPEMNAAPQDQPAMQSSMAPQPDTSQQAPMMAQPDLPQQTPQDPVLNSVSQDQPVSPVTPNTL